MSALLFVKPWPALAATGTMARIATPDPKEAVLGVGGTLFLDMGVPVTADAIYIGYHTAAADQQFAAYTTDATFGGQLAMVVQTTTIAQPGIGVPYPDAAYHRLVRFAPATSRYWRVDFNGGSAQGGTPYLIGTLAFGQTFQPKYGHEYGAGRLITDTGTAERMFGGSFGIDEGARIGGWSFTLGDLTDSDITGLYRLARAVGTTRSVLVVEDPDITEGLNERIHWGLFAKLDPYERYAPGATRWALRIDDWA